MTFFPSTQGQRSYDPGERAAIIQEVEARLAPEDSVLRDCVAHMWSIQAGKSRRRRENCFRCGL